MSVLAQDLRDPNFSREIHLAAIEEGVSIQIALGKVIRAIGIKEFSARIKIASPNILRAINPRHNPNPGNPQSPPKTIQP